MMAGGDPTMDAELVAGIRDALQRQRATTITPSAGDKHAAVTLLVGLEEAQPSILFIRRAEWVNDPWSGHTALPGGHVGRSDADLLETARRELREEIGVALTREDYLGRLNDLRPSARSPSIVVSPFVAWVDTPVSIRTSREIQSQRWIPIHALRDPAHQSELSHMSRGLKLMFPSIVYKGFTIWGLTHAVVSNFLEVTRDL